MANQYMPEHPARAISVKLLTRGVATVAELANHFGLARQTVQQWAKGIDVRRARSEFVARAVLRARPRK